MRLFQYRGRRQGEAVWGRLEGSSLEGVASHLASVGITPIEITELVQTDDAVAFLRSHLQRKKIDLEDLIVFSRQMYAMVRAGIPILRAIGAIAETAHSRSLASALADVAESLKAGHDLTSSLRRHPKVFPTLFISIVHMGEDAGRLEEAFAQLAAYLELERDTRRRLKTATRYPLVVVGAMVIALIILNFFVLPVFAEVFEEFQADLPWATNLLIRTSELSARYWRHALLAAGVATLGVRGYVATPGGRHLWHYCQLRLPVVGRLIEKAILGRFARTFALALRSGVPLMNAIGIAGDVMNNAYMQERIRVVKDHVDRGESLTRAARASQLFTPLVLQMMYVGEESGSLDDLLGEVAEFYERDVDYELTRLVDSLQPILIVGIGGLVLLLALGVYLPMWDLAGAARGG